MAKTKTVYERIEKNYDENLMRVAGYFVDGSTLDKINAGKQITERIEELSTAIAELPKESIKAEVADLIINLVDDAVRMMENFEECF